VVVIGVLLITTLATILAVDRHSDARAMAGLAGAQAGTVEPPTARPSPADGHLSGSASSPDSSAARVTPPAGSNAGTQNDVPAHPADAIDDLLSERAAAIRDGDRAAWLASLDPVHLSPAALRFRAAQADVFDRVHSLAPAAWSYQVAGGSPLPAARVAELGGIAWLADVQLDYQLVGGATVVRRQQFLTIVQRGGQWRIASDLDGDTQRDIWDLGPITKAASSRCLVVGASSRRAQVAQLAGDCTLAAPIVDDAWGTGWTRRTVLTIPPNLDQLAILLGREDGARSPDATAGLDRTAAVTIGPSDGAADGVLINGQAFQQLSNLGRRVVLTHELVHVATRATGSTSAPTWLAEGFADYVAYRNTDLSPDQIAGDALDAVRAGRTPENLPAVNDFNAAGNQAAAAYGFSWIAVQEIAAKADGTQRMKAFYQQAARGGASALNEAFAVVGLSSLSAFVPKWRARLAELAR
jgi:hypothetical protein